MPITLDGNGAITELTATGISAVQQLPTTGTITNLTTTTISDGTNSTSSTNCIQGSAKAWVNYNQTSQTIAASYNVSSVTYTATGDFRVNFTNPLTDANYTVAGQANDNANNARILIVNVSNGYTNTYCSIGVRTVSLTGFNCNNATVAFFR
jgi:hypothetical protein